MKKVLLAALLLLLTVCLLLSACGGGQTPTTDAATEASATHDGLSSDDIFGGGNKETAETEQQGNSPTLPSGGEPETGPIALEGRCFFRPAEAGTGDIIPIYYDGLYYIFFLHSTNHKWCYVTTSDFVTYSEVVPLRIFGGTGDVLCVDGTWHIFAALSDAGHEVIHHYTGSAINELRDTYKTVSPDGTTFAMSAWRDPRVWYDEEIGKYRMLVCADILDGNCVNRNGAVAFLTSDDLENWTVTGESFSPGFYSGSCECPDFFKIGDWYYLVYSDCSYGKRTYYAKAKSLDGPWEIPDNDTFDSLFFYAAKTVSNGTDRYILGWAGDRSDHTMALDKTGDLTDPDFATIKYAGNAIIHKLVQLPNGDLSVAPVDEIVASYAAPVSNTMIPLVGDWQTTENSASISSDYGFSSLLMQNLPDNFVLRFQMKCDAKQAGIALNVDSTYCEKGYYFVFDRQYSRVRQVSGLLSGIAGYYFPYESELERPLQFEAGKTYDVTLICEGQIAVLYVNGECALTTRMMADTRLALGLFCYAGSAEFSDIVMTK